MQYVRINAWLSLRPDRLSRRQRWWSRLSGARGTNSASGQIAVTRRASQSRRVPLDLRKQRTEVDEYLSELRCQRLGLEQPLVLLDPHPSAWASMLGTTMV